MTRINKKDILEVWYYCLSSKKKCVIHFLIKFSAYFHTFGIISLHLIPQVHHYIVPKFVHFNRFPIPASSEPHTMPHNTVSCVRGDNPISSWWTFHGHALTHLRSAAWQMTHDIFTHGNWVALTTSSYPYHRVLYMTPLRYYNIVLGPFIIFIVK